MSRFSLEVLLGSSTRIKPEKIHLIHCPADIDRFFPLTPGEKKELRESLFPPFIPPGAFILGWVGRNTWRKQVWLLYKTLAYIRNGEYLLCSDGGGVTLGELSNFSMRTPHPHFPELQPPDERILPPFSERRPGSKDTCCCHCGSRVVMAAEPLRDVFLWIHMPEGDPEQEWPSSWLEYQYGLRPDRDLFYTEGYTFQAALPPEEMPTLYQLWDALLYLSGSEGFALPVWEAMASGIPVVYSDYSSHAEYAAAASAGIPVRGILQPQRKTEHWRMIADVAEAVRAVRSLYYDRLKVAKLGANGRGFVSRFSKARQVKIWEKCFKDLLSEQLTRRD